MKEGRGELANAQKCKAQGQGERQNTAKTKKMLAKNSAEKAEEEREDDKADQEETNGHDQEKKKQLKNIILFLCAMFSIDINIQVIYNMIRFSL